MKKKIFTSEPYKFEELRKEIIRVYEDDFWVGGKTVDQLEGEYADFVGVDHAIAVSNGTEALRIVLQCLFERGNVGEIITTPSTFKATTESIVLTGHKPVFADIDKHTWNIDPENIKELINKNTKAILPVHLYVMPCNINEIMSIAKEHHIPVIEDACQAHGASYNGIMIGSSGIAGCWSFYTTKIMAAGQGGMITTDDPMICKGAKNLREHQSYRNHFGSNARMTTDSAARALAHLHILNDLNYRRKEIAQIYDNELKDLPLDLPPPYSGRVYYLYVIRTHHRDRLLEYLKDKGIFCGVHYPKPVHLEEEFKKYCTRRLINSEKLSKTCLSLPCHQTLSDEDVYFICKNIKKFFYEE